MKNVSLALAVSLLLSVDAIHASEAKKSGPSWPPVSGWRSETIPFPLDFAPDIKREGVEEIRFAPGFGKPLDASYFTYAFVWNLSTRPKIDADGLRKELKLYFDGLMRAVAKEAKLDLPVDTKIDLEPVTGPAGAPSFRASVATVDAFYTKKPLLLKMNVYADACPGPTGGRTVYFEVSPRLADEPIAKALAEVRGRLACK